MSGSCPFCAIAVGDRDQEVVYAEDSVVALPVRAPATRGHLLVVPRTHVEDLWSIGREDLQAVFACVHLLAGDPANGALAVGDQPPAELGQACRPGRAGLPRARRAAIRRRHGSAWLRLGRAPWEPPSGGDEERRRVADALRAAVEAAGG